MDPPFCYGFPQHMGSYVTLYYTCYTSYCTCWPSWMLSWVTLASTPAKSRTKGKESLSVALSLSIFCDQELEHAQVTAQTLQWHLGIKQSEPSNPQNKYQR